MNIEKEVKKCRCCSCKTTLYFTPFFSPPSSCDSCTVLVVYSNNRHGDDGFVEETDHIEYMLKRKLLDTLVLCRDGINRENGGNGKKKLTICHRLLSAAIVACWGETEKRN
jgi:hypothetical protein